MKRAFMLASLLALAGCAAAPTTGAPGAPQQASHLDRLPPIIPLEHFFDNPEIAGAQVSPDGRWLAYLKPWQGRLNIHVRPIAGGEERRMTADTVRPVSAYFWSVDGSQILYVQDRGGDENFHVYAVPLAGTGVPEARNLTPFPGVRTMINAVPRELPDRILISMNRRDRAMFDAYWLNVVTGELTLAVENPGRFLGVVLDPENRVRVAQAQNERGETVIHARDTETAPWREVARFPAEAQTGVLRFHPNGRQLYLVSQHGDTDLARLALLDLANGALTPLESDPLGQADFGGALFSEITKELLATVYVADTVRIYPKTDEFARDLARLRQVHHGAISIGSRTYDERQWVVQFNSPTDPGATYLFDRDTGEATFLFRPRPWLRSEQLAEMRPVSYPSRDGLTIHGYLTTPRGAEPRNLPMVLLVHGGPWARDFWGYQPEVQLLANRGYAVLQVNFRGSTGFGKTFFNAAVNEFGRAMHDDLIDGLNWAVAQGIADPARVGIYGGSYGGYATLVGMTFTPEVFACGVAYVAPSSLITLIESFPAYWRPFMESTWFRFVGDPSIPEVRRELEARSPLYHVDRIQRPLLIVHGANDPRVTKLESDQLAIALRDRGVPVRYIIAWDEGHGFANADNRLALYRSMETFFQGCLGGRAQPEAAPAVQQRIARMTVDVDTLRLPTADAAGGEAAAPVAFRGDAVRPGTHTYRTVTEMQGRQVEGEATQVVAEGTLEGRRVWVLTETAQSPMGTAVDTLFLDATSLHPLRRRVHQGPAQISVEYAEGSVTGSIQAGPQQIPINATVEGRAFAEGSALALGLRSAGLQPGTRAAAPIFDLLGGRAVPHRIEAVAEEQVTVPAGAFQALRVEIAPEDGSPGGSTVWIERAAPHRVLRTVTRLPPQMGGGTVSSELVR